MPEKYDRDGIPIASKQKPHRGLYGVAAPLYLERGYPPIPVKGKTLLVKGATGYSGSVTPEKVEDWCNQFPYADVALRLEGCLGVDIDDHGPKSGWAQLAELEDRLGPLPATYSSTSRGRFSNSRIYIYRVEEDVPRRSRAATHIDVIHKFHRYLVAFPSTHPRTRETDHWYGPDGELASGEGPPAPSQLPLLPPSWDKYLRKGAESLQKTHSPRRPFEGRLEDWEGSLDSGQPSENVAKLQHAILRCPHIGHNELLYFAGGIERLSNETKSQGLRVVYDLLKEKYFAETNEANPHKEWDDVFRWLISEDWQAKRTSWQVFVGWAALLISENGTKNA